MIVQFHTELDLPEGKECVEVEASVFPKKALMDPEMAIRPGSVIFSVRDHHGKLIRDILPRDEYRLKSEAIAFARSDIHFKKLAGMEAASCPA